MRSAIGAVGKQLTRIVGYRDLAEMMQERGMRWITPPSFIGAALGARETVRPSRIAAPITKTQRSRQKLMQQSRHSDPHGFDPGEKIKRKKRQILVDTQGGLRRAVVHAANV